MVYSLREILKEEGETALLMEQVRLHPETVFHYGDVLAPEHGKEVCDLCAAAIREDAKRIDNRKVYQRLCGLLQSLVDFGGPASGAGADR